MNTKNKVSDRYLTLVTIANDNGITFERASRPTAKDCEALSALIDEKRSLSSNAEAACDASIATPSVVVEKKEVSAVVDERLAALEAKREEARRRFVTATKATTAHGYALIGAATNDGDRLENMRAKLAEMPEGIRAQACKLAAQRLAQPGSRLQEDLRKLYDEQPVAAKVSSAGTKIGGRRDALTTEAIVRKANGGEIILRGTALKTLIGVAFKVTHKIDDNGKLSIFVEQV